LVSLVPPLDVCFPSGIGGELIALHVQLGHWVRAGDSIASVDDVALRRELYAAQRTVEQAKAARAAAEQRAEAAYKRAQQAAQWDLNRAYHAVQVAEKQPPTTAIARAEATLAGALAAVEHAADAYKQSLDRSWEAAEVRDTLYQTWQTAITSRKLAELDLQDAQMALAVHEMNLTELNRELARARIVLDSLEQEVDASLAWAEGEALQALTEVQERQALTDLYAPRDGLVVAIGAVAGATVTSGTPIVTLLDAQELRFVTTNLQEGHAARLRPGQSARIVLRFYPETLILGEVELLVPVVRSQSESRFLAYLRLTDTGGLSLLPGMTGRAEISVAGE
jgi:multidrug resistance efflux pump